MVEQLVAHQPEQWTDDGAQGVHRAVEAEHPAAHRLIDLVDQQRVPRRAADAFAEPIDDATREHTGPRPGHRDDYLAERRHSVAGGDQWASRKPVAQRARREFCQRGRTLGRALDGSHHRRWRTQHGCEVDRQQRIQQFTGGVLQERHC